MNPLPCSRCLRLIRRCLSGRCLSSSAALSQSYRLVEIGKLEEPQASGYYQAGQVTSLMIHESVWFSVSVVM